jgi:hypothetical protein
MVCAIGTHFGNKKAVAGLLGGIWGAPARGGHEV